MKIFLFIYTLTLLVLSIIFHKELRAWGEKPIAQLEIGELAFICVMIMSVWGLFKSKE